jgi:hypothetical protein
MNDIDDVVTIAIKGGREDEQVEGTFHGTFV